MALKTYILSIMYDEDVDEIEYINEEIEEDKRYFKVGEIDLVDYFDEDSLNIIDEMYDVGIT